MKIINITTCVRKYEVEYEGVTYEVYHDLESDRFSVYDGQTGYFVLENNTSDTIIQFINQFEGSTTHKDTYP